MVRSPLPSPARSDTDINRDAINNLLPGGDATALRCTAIAYLSLLRAGRTETARLLETIAQIEFGDEEWRREVRAVDMALEDE